MNGIQLYNVTGDTFDPLYHQNGIYQLTSAYASNPDCYIRNSFIHDTYAGANTVYANPNHGGTTWCYNNVIYGHQTDQCAFEIQTDQFGTTAGQFIGYNNTLAQFDASKPAFHVSMYLGTKLNVLTIFNNQVINNTYGLTDADGTNTTTYTNGTNLIQSSATATAQGYVLGNLYAPTTGGATIGAGTDESAAGFTTDILGVTRSGAWDIGAYEFVGGGSGGTGGSATGGTLTIGGTLTL